MCSKLSSSRHLFLRNQSAVELAADEDERASTMSEAFAVPLDMINQVIESCML